MTVRERLLALRLLEWQEKRPACMEELGVFVSLQRNIGGEPKKVRENHV